jgi:hypothetical protein
MKYLRELLVMNFDEDYLLRLDEINKMIFNW